MCFIHLYSSSMLRKSAILNSVFCVLLAGCLSLEPSTPLSQPAGGTGASSSVARVVSASSSSHEEILILETTPEQKLLGAAQKVIIRGRADSGVPGIRAWKFCNGQHSGNDNVPVAADGGWTYTYAAEPLGICRGRSSIVFQSVAHCQMERYSPGCDVSKSFEFTSQAGYLYPYAVMMAPDKIDAADDAVLRGYAGPSVRSVEARAWCVDAGTTEIIEIPRPVDARGEWQWELRLREEDKTKCQGRVSVDVWSNPKCIEHCEFQHYASVQRSFTDGYLPPEREQAMRKVLALEKRAITEVTSDPFITTRIASDLLVDCADIGEENPPLPPVVVPDKRLSDGITVRLIGSGTLAFLEFNAEPSTGVVAPQRFLHSCNDAIIHYLRPDRIILDEGTGFETGPHIYVWDGTLWNTPEGILKGQVAVQTPLDIGGVNSKYFVIREVPYCCSITAPVVPGRWARYVIDVETMKIVDVYFEEGS